MKTIDDILKDYVEDYSVHIRSIDWSHDTDIVVTFGLNLYGPPEQSRQVWKCTGHGHLTCRINEAPSIWALDMPDDSPLIWITDENRSSLNFNENKASASELKATFVEVHTKLFGQLVEQDLFLNRANGHLAILASGFGQFADGPTRIMEAYREVFQRHNVKHTILPYPVPKIEKDRKVFRIGASFFIAEDFTFEKLP